MAKVKGTPAPDVIGPVFGPDPAFDGDDTISAGAQNDTVDTGPGRNWANGNGGDDWMFGGDNLDTLHGGAQNDTLVGGGERDLLYGDLDDDLIFGGTENDTIFGDGLLTAPERGVGADPSKHADRIFAGRHDDLVFSGPGPDEVHGDQDSDTLYGGHENDTLDGGTGRDTLVGGPDDDRLTGGDDRDTFVFGSGSGKDVVTDFDPDRDRIIVEPGVNGTGIDDPDALRGRLSTNANGDAVLDLGGGNTVTFTGVGVDELVERPPGSPDPFVVDYY